MTFSDRACMHAYEYMHEGVLKRQNDDRRTEWLPFSRASRGYLSRPSDGRTGKDFVNVENVRSLTELHFVFDGTRRKIKHIMIMQFWMFAQNTAQKEQDLLSTTIWRD